MRWHDKANDHERFTIRDVPLHLVYVNFTYYLTILVGGSIGSVHVNVHHMFGDSLSSNEAMEPRTGYILLTLSRCSSCTSFTIKIISNRDSIVV